MRRINNCIEKKNYKNIPIWFMRQAGRYLKEFRNIRNKNENFIKLCLNQQLAKTISEQPIKRFDLDGIIIFSDILIVPYGLGQGVKFQKTIGPVLESPDFKKILNTEKKDFIKKVGSVYKTINLLKKDMDYNNKSLIGFVAAPWTLLVYMFHKKSPKTDFDINKIFKDKSLIKNLISKLEYFICLHIDEQIKAGANVIQIFDSWAGLLPKKKLLDYCYKPNLRIVNHIKKKNIPIICFPKGIKKEDYSEFCSIVKPGAISIDNQINPEWIKNKVNNLPIQGGLDPKILLTEKNNVKKNVEKYLNIFSDYPYIFNLGHGVLPQTDPAMIKFVIKIIRDRA